MLFNLTKHAEQRLQQRGFKFKHISLILEFGEVKHKPGNCLEYKIFKKDIKRIQTKKSSQSIQIIDKCCNKAILVDEKHNTLITMYNLS